MPVRSPSTRPGSVTLIVPAEWVTVAPSRAPSTSRNFVWARMPRSLAWMSPLLVTSTAPVAPAPSCDTKMPCTARASALPMAPLLVTEMSPVTAGRDTAQMPAAPTSRAPLLVTSMSPDPAEMAKVMPALGARIVPALTTVTPPPAAPASVSAPRMPWPCVEVSTTPEETRTSIEPPSWLNASMGSHFEEIDPPVTSTFARPVLRGAT